LLLSRRSNAPRSLLSFATIWLIGGFDAGFFFVVVVVVERWAILYRIYIMDASMRYGGRILLYSSAAAAAAAARHCCRSLRGCPLRGLGSRRRRHCTLPATSASRVMSLR